MFAPRRAFSAASTGMPIPAAEHDQRVMRSFRSASASQSRMRRRRAPPAVPASAGARRPRSRRSTAPRISVVHQFVPVQRAQAVLRAAQHQRRHRHARPAPPAGPPASAAPATGARTPPGRAPPPSPCRVQDRVAAAARRPDSSVSSRRALPRAGRPAVTRAICGSRRGGDRRASRPSDWCPSGTARPPVRGPAPASPSRRSRPCSARPARTGPGATRSTSAASARMVSAAETGATITARSCIAAICGANSRASHIMPGNRTSGVICRCPGAARSGRFAASHGREGTPDLTAAQGAASLSPTAFVLREETDDRLLHSCRVRRCFVAVVGRA